MPNDLYEAVRNRAKANRRSIAAEVVALLQQNVPTEQELKARHEWLQKLIGMRKERSNASGRGHTFPSTEEMSREDRER